MRNRKKAAPLIAFVVKACIISLMALPTTGCLSMMGLGPKRLAYRERMSAVDSTILFLYEDKKMNIPGEYIQKVAGKPDWVVRYGELAQFMPDSDLRKGMERAIEAGLTRAGATLPTQGTADYTLWCYEERKRFGWMGFFSPGLDLYLIDQQGNIVAFGSMFTNESIEKTQKRFREK